MDNMTISYNILIYFVCACLCEVVPFQSSQMDTVFVCSKVLIGGMSILDRSWTLVGFYIDWKLPAKSYYVEMV